MVQLLRPDASEKGCRGNPSIIGAMHTIFQETHLGLLEQSFSHPVFQLLEDEFRVRESFGAYGISRIAQGV